MVRLKLQADSQMVDQKVEVTFKKNYLRYGVQNCIETTGKGESSPAGLRCPFSGFEIWLYSEFGENYQGIK